MSQSKSEALSFFNANAVPLPDSTRALFDVYLTPEGDLKLITSQDTKTVGNIAPIQPISVDQATLVDGELSLKMTDGTVIPIGNIERPDTYNIPTLSGIGLRQSSGNFELPQSDIPEVTIEEEVSGFRVSATGLSGAREIKRLECAVRRDYTGQADSSVYDNTGMVLNQWFTGPALTFLADPDDIGASLVSGKLVLPPGIYYVNWRCGAYRTNVTATRLYSVTHSNEIIRGPSMYYTNNTDCSVILMHNSGYFKLTEPTTIEIQARVGNVSSSTMWWSAHFAIMGKIADLLHLEIFKYPDNVGNIPEVKRIREVTKRMTSYVNGNLTVAASSEYSAAYPAWRVLDGDTLTSANSWASAAAPTEASPQWVSFVFSDSAKRVTRYRVWLPNTAGPAAEGFTSFRLEGRNLATDEWVVLDIMSGWNIFVPSACCERVLTQPAEYFQYRIVFTGRNGTQNWVYVAECRLYEDY